MMSRHARLASWLAALILPATDTAAQQIASPTHALGGNVGLVSNYVSRGLSQTNYTPAWQGTLEYAHASGLYAGLFGSNVTWLADAWEPAAPGVDEDIYGGVVADVISKSLELDLYIGHRGGFLEHFSYDAGFITYLFPGRYTLDTATYPGLSKPTTHEVRAGLGWRWFSAGLWVTVSDAAFMVGDARGTWYGNLSANVPLGRTGVSLYGHIGRWNWAGNAGFLRPYGLDNDIYDLTDWKLGATIDWQGLNFGLFYTGSTARDTAATAPGTNPGGGDRFAAWGNRFGQNIGNDSVWLQIRKTF